MTSRHLQTATAANKHLKAENEALMQTAGQNSEQLDFLRREMARFRKVHRLKVTIKPDRQHSAGSRLHSLLVMFAGAFNPALDREATTMTLQAISQ